MPVRPARRVQIACLVAAPLAACASGGTSRAPIDEPMANQPATTRIEGMAGTAEVRTFTSAASTAESAIGAPPTKVFVAFPPVYDALGVPVNTVLSDAGTFGVRDMRMPRRLGKAPLSQYVDCGAGPSGLANADQYAVTMTVLSRVTPGAGAGSVVTTQLTATARPITVAGNAVQCASTGRLEAEINRRLAEEALR